MKTAFLGFALVLLISAPSFAAHSHPEKYYQAKWCAANNGQAEVILPDKTLADCITTTHAIEFDFGKKWAESLGQALYYSLQIRKRGEKQCADCGKAGRWKTVHSLKRQDSTFRFSG